MEQRYIRLLLSSLVTLLAIQSNTQVEAQELPRLVVCISVDQLRGELLKELSPMMGKDGFQELLAGGLYYPSLSFPIANPNASSSTASIHTGTFPTIHGIIGAKKYDPKKDTWVNTFTDNRYNGVYSRDKVSPKSLRVLTLGDRLKLASKNSGLVYSIAPSMGQALVSAGQLADGAYWIDDVFASWASSSYYSPIPVFLSSYENSVESISRRLKRGNVYWKPSQKYQDKSIKYSSWDRTFTHSYTSKNIDEFKQSAKVNEEITDLAIKFVENAGYEYRKSPSLLSISYTLKPQKEEELSAEDIDMYLRLNQDLKRLFLSLDKKISLKDCLIILSGTGYVDLSSNFGTRAYRRVDCKKVKAILNMYLSALYGTGQWVQEFANGQLFLNKQLIEAKKQAKEVICKSTIDILQDIEGIASAYSPQQVLNGQVNLLRNSLDKKNLADVYWEILPSWDVAPRKNNQNVQPKTRAIQSPLIIYRAGHQFSKEDFIVQDVRDIVKVVCQILRIRPPN